MALGPLGLLMGGSAIAPGMAKLQPQMCIVGRSLSRQRFEITQIGGQIQDKVSRFFCKI